MSRKKGVTAEEKKVRLLQLFHEKRDFFQLKELEKIAPKEKGIIAQCVKDVVQSLVDDGLVNSDKIGTSIYYWAYPSTALYAKKKKIEELNAQSNELLEKIAVLKADLTQSKKKREDTEERQNILKEILSLKKVESELQVQLEKSKQSDPKIIKQLNNDISELKNSINKWTDNIYMVKSWCKNKFAIEGDAIDKQFGIPHDLDYIEY